MRNSHGFEHVAAIVTCGIALTSISVLAQVAVSFKAGPWELREIGVGDPRPDIGPIVHVPFDDIQRRYHQIEPGQLDLRVTVDADCDGKGKQFVDLSLEVAGHPAALRVGVLGKKSGGGFTGLTTAATKAPIATTLKSLDIPNPVATCNDDLKSFVAGRQHGKAQQGWARRYDRALPVTMHLSCQSEDKKKFGGLVDPGDISEASRRVDFPIWVHCRPAKVFQTTDGGGKAPAHGPEPQRTKSTPPPVTPVVATLSLPDLVIKSVVERDERTLSIEVANIGALTASPSSLQLFYHRSGHVMKKSFPVPTIAANQTAWIVANVGSPLAAASQILLRIDDPSSVAEQDETNNSYKVK